MLLREVPGGRRPADPGVCLREPVRAAGCAATQFGFTGWVGSDYGASHATSDILGGLDQEFLSTNLAPAALKPLVDPSSPTFDPAYATALDDAVARILYQYQRFGRLDDSSYPAGAKTHVRPAPAPAPFDEQAGIEAARRLAEESAVLLKNDNGVLPLSRDPGSSVAIIGPTADVCPGDRPVRCGGGPGEAGRAARGGAERRRGTLVPTRSMPGA